MKLLCLLGHRYIIQQIGVTSVMYCPRCGKAFILMERVNKVTGDPQEDYWKEVSQQRAKARR